MRISPYSLSKSSHVRVVILCFLGFLPFSGVQASRASSNAQTNTQVSSSAIWNEDIINVPLSSSIFKNDKKESFRRVIQARLFHQGAWTLPGVAQTPLSIGRTLASLRPTFVTGLIRVPDYGGISNAEIEAFKVVRSAVNSLNKGCQFDLVVNAGDESFGSVFVEHLKQINSKIRPDAWTFLVRPNDKEVNALVLAKGISYAHSCGQIVGFEGPLSLIPQGVDFIVMRAWDFKANKSTIEALHEKYAVPVIVELPTTFGKSSPPEVVSYVKSPRGSERASIVTQLAEDQSVLGYRFAYPLIYPLYPNSHSFDATKDSILFVTIRALMAKFN